MLLGVLAVTMVDALAVKRFMVDPAFKNAERDRVLNGIRRY
ncbi:MAG: hypothetical protein ABSD68_00645 [Candidatus Micrarchaeales archaeon]|jgi:hypothetical protein